MPHNRSRLGLASACLILLTACQVLLPAQPPVQTVAANPTTFPDNDVAEGVKAFKSTYSTEGMAGVGRNIAKCQNAALRHAAADLVRQCLSFEMAALAVSAAHDNRMHTQPLPNLSKTDFTKRFDLYFGELGLAPDSRGTAADDLFRRVLPLVQPS